jgi:hypothetical protein
MFLVFLLLSLPYLISNFGDLVKTNIKNTTSHLKHSSGLDYSNEEEEEGLDEPLRKKEAADTSDSRAPPSLISGTVGEDNIAYYHQPATVQTEENHHLILLHGAKFTKEDWKTSKILDKFMRHFPSITITALDLPVRADHSQLEALLRSMRDEDLIEQLPVSALVTPSASGKSITTWITEESSAGMDSFLSVWIPVAPASVSSCRPEQLATLKDIVEVFAIYGDMDGMGERVSESLKAHAGATTLELPGRHPVYLDSPDPFVEAVAKKVLAVQ